MQWLSGQDEGPSLSKGFFSILSDRIVREAQHFEAGQVRGAGEGGQALVAERVAPERKQAKVAQRSITSGRLLD